MNQKNKYIGKLPRAVVSEIHDRVLNPLNVIQLAIELIDDIAHKQQVEQIKRNIDAIHKYVRSLEDKSEFDGGPE